MLQRIRRIRPFPPQKATQFWSSFLSSHVCSCSLLAGPLPFVLSRASRKQHTGIQPAHILPHYAVPPHPALATWSDHTPQPINSVSAPSLSREPAASQHLYCLQTWLRHGGTRILLTSGQQKPCSSPVKHLKVIFSDGIFARRNRKKLSIYLLST